MKTMPSVVAALLPVSMIALTGVVLLPTPAESSSSCETVRAWVATNKGQLPASYEELNRYSMDYRRAIYATHAPAVKSTLWREHFSTFLAAHPELKPEQRAIVEDAYAVATPELFARPEAYRAEMDSLAARAQEVFGRDGARALFAVLGAPDSGTPGGSPEPMAYCSCSQESDWCESDRHCGSGDCQIDDDSCGTFWTYDCDGHCEDNAT